MTIDTTELRYKILGAAYAFDIPPATKANENITMRIELEPLLTIFTAHQTHTLKAISDMFAIPYTELEAEARDYKEGEK